MMMGKEHVLTKRSEKQVSVMKNRIVQYYSLSNAKQTLAVPFAFLLCGRNEDSQQ